MLHTSDDMLRLREAEHRYRNSLQLAQGLTRAKLRHAQSPEAQEALGYVVELLDILKGLQVTLRGDGTLDLAKRVGRLCDHMRRLCDDNVALELRTDSDLAVSPKAVSTICLITLELVMNAIKHAFPDGRSGVIRVTLQHAGDDCATLVVEDDGVGLEGSQSPGVDDDHGFGLELIDYLARGLAGTVSSGRGPDGGHVVAITWPI